MKTEKLSPKEKTKTITTTGSLAVIDALLSE